MNKKIWILGACAIAIILVAAVVSVALLQNQNPSYTALLEKGERYLNAGDYKQAVVMYRRAVSERPTRADGYIGLAQAYTGLGKQNLAIITLSNGYQMTHNLTIRRRLEELDPASVERLEQKNAANDASPETLNRTETDQELSLNTELLTFLSTASYGDYQREYGTLQNSQDGAVCVLHISALDISLRFYNTDTVSVLDASGMPYRECIPNEIVFENLKTLFGDVPQVTYEQLQSLRQLSELKRTDDRVTFSLCGCSIALECDENGTICQTASILVVPTQEQPEAGGYRVSGRVLDAESGATVSGAKIRFRAAGIGGEEIEVTTSVSGSYEVELKESGTYRIRIRKDGYIEEETETYFSGGTQEEFRDFSISQVLQQGEIRLVLTWNSYPTDLDSYLTGSTDSGKNVSVSFHNKTSSANGDTLAALDVDDQNGYGPETVTLYAMNGTYEYYIKDYLETGELSNSGAQIKIYKGDTLVKVIDVCGDLGNIWYVCRIDHGTIIATNHG